MQSYVHLRKEVKALRDSWSSKNVTTPMPGNISAAPTPSTAGGGDLQTRYERLKEVFHKRMQRFREAVPSHGFQGRYGEHERVTETSITLDLCGA